MIICLERGADLHMAQLMPLPLTVFCFSKIQMGFAFLVVAHPVVPENGLLNGCVCMCYCRHADGSVKFWDVSSGKFIRFTFYVRYMLTYAP